MDDRNRSCLSGTPGLPHGHISFTLGGSTVFASLQSGPSAELEAQNSNLGEGSILLSSLTLGQEEQCLVALGEVRLRLGI